MNATAAESTQPAHKAVPDAVKRGAEKTRNAGTKVAGQISLDRLPVVLGILFVTGLMAVFTADITDDVKQDVNSTQATNAADNVLTAIVDITSWFDNLGTLVIAGIAISLLMGGFFFGFMQKRGGGRRGGV